MKTPLRRFFSSLPFLFAGVVAGGPQTEVSLTECTPPPTPAGEWNWNITLPVRFGYESNPRSLSDEVLRRPGVGHKSSLFTEINPRVQFGWQALADTRLVVAYDLDKFYYHDQSDINVTVHNFSASVEQKMGDATVSFDTKYAIALGDEETRFHKLILGPTWSQRWNPREKSSMTYNFIVTEAHLSDGANVAPVQDPDSINHYVSVAHTHFLREECPTKGDPGFGVTLLYAHSWQNADGANFDLQRNRLRLGLDGKPFGPSHAALHDFSFSTAYTHDFDHFTQEYTLPEVGGIGRNRSDNTDQIDVSISHPINFKLSWKDEAVFSL